MIEDSAIQQARSIPLSAIVRRDVKISRSSNEWQGKCPFHADKSPSFYVNDAKGLYHCFGCGASGDVIDFTRRIYRLTFEDAIKHLVAGHADLKATIVPQAKADPEEAERKTQIALKIWSECCSIDGTIAETYLRSRGITIPLPPTLRFHPALAHPTGLILPAMVAAVIGSPNRGIVAIHRTYLKSTGSPGKIPATKPRLMLGPCSGAAVRLAPISATIAIAEGIETALSVMQMTGLPTWAALSDGGIERLILPDEAKYILICADHDENGVGQEAARKAAERWKADGRHVRVAKPPDVGQDFNDVLRIKGFQEGRKFLSPEWFQTP